MSYPASDIVLIIAAASAGGGYLIRCWRNPGDATQSIVDGFTSMQQQLTQFALHLPPTPQRPAVPSTTTTASVTKTQTLPQTKP